MADRQQWGKALQGMGAWWAGRGPQYEESMRRQESDRLAQEEAEQQRRRQAMIDDTMVMGSLVEAGDMGGLMNILMDRHDAVIGLGGNAEHTERTINRLMSSNPAEVEAAKMDILRARNLLDPQKQQETKFQKGGTSIMRTPDGQFVSVMPTLDPSTGDQTVQVTPIQGIDGAVPVMVNSMGQTPEEQLKYGVTETSLNRQAEDAAATSTKYLEQVRGARNVIARLDDVVTAIDKGADSGVVARRLPSVRAASQRLDHVQKELGLAVLQNTTFGALSEKELEFALDTALPTNLQDQELRQWALDKKAAQEKLADYLEEAAIYLATPGNTLASWTAMQREMEKAGKAKAGGLPVVSSQADFDALPSGARFIEDGVEYTKP